MMKKIDKYNKFNEGLFSKRMSFDDYIEQIDQLFLLYEEARGKAVHNKYDTIYDHNEKGRSLIKALGYMATITSNINRVLIEYGRKMDQEMMDEVVKRFKEVRESLRGKGYKLKDYSSIDSIIKDMNSIFNLLEHIMKFYDLKVDIGERKFDDPTVLFKHNGYYYLAPKSYSDKKDKEAREKHANVDPYGEENWDDEVVKNEGIKWYIKGKWEDSEIKDDSRTCMGDDILRVGDKSKSLWPEHLFGERVKWYNKGHLGEEENIDVDEYDDFITNYFFRQFLIDNKVYDIYIKHTLYNNEKVWDKRFRDDPADIINSTLTWSSTPTPNHRRGGDSSFWEKLSQDWRKYYRNNKDMINGK